MSSNNPESQGQDWPIYPGTPGGQGGSGTPQPSRSEPDLPTPPYAEPSAGDEAYRAYQSYAYQQPTQHGRLTPHSQRPRSSHGLQQKYMWIAIGVVAALVITSMAGGGFNLWPLIIFGGIVWWIVSRKRNC